MADPRPTEGRSRHSLPRRLWQWVDKRTGVERLLRHSLAEPIPGGARLAYVFGSALLFIFLSQLVTGICLALYYVPSPLSAHTSVAYIVKEVAGGSFLRSLHSYGSSAMVVVLVLHFLQTFFYGSYKGRRELLWISGCTLSLLVLGMTFTGYLLSWDQRAYSAGSVGTDIVGQVPFIGETLRLLLRGGTTMGALTLSRFYVLHILVVPGLIFAFVAIHVVLFRKAGAAGPVTEDPVKPSLPTEMFYPKQVLIDMAFALFVMGVLGMLAHFVPVTLGLQAESDEYPLLAASRVVLPADVSMAEVLARVADSHRGLHHTGDSDWTVLLATVHGPRPRAAPVAQTDSRGRRLDRVDRHGVARPDQPSRGLAQPHHCRPARPAEPGRERVLPVRFRAVFGGAILR